MKVSSFFALFFFSLSSSLLAADIASSLSCTKVSLSDKIGAAEPEKQLWNFSVGAGLDVRSGNTESTAYKGHAEAKKDSEKTSFRSRIEGATTIQEKKNEEGVTEDDRSVANAKGLLSYKFIFDKSFVYLDGSALNDDVASVSYRFIESLGVGRYLLRQDNFDFSIQMGLAYVQERVSSVDDCYLGYRVAERIDFRPNDKGVTLFESCEGIFDFEKSNQYLINGEVGMEVPVFDGFALVFKYVIQYNSNAAEDVESMDRQCVTYFSYKF